MSQNNEQNDDIYTLEDVAHKLLMDTGIDSFSKQLLIFQDQDDQHNQTNSLGDVHSIKFQTCIELSMEILFQYLFLMDLASKSNQDENDENDENDEIGYNMSNMNITDVEELLKKLLKKLCVVPLISESHANDTGYYVRAVFKDTCSSTQREKFFANNAKNFHFLLNPRFDTNKVKKLEDVYGHFYFNGTPYSIKFFIHLPSNMQE